MPESTQNDVKEIGLVSKADIVVGIQWGDEGKGRIVDLYASKYDVVARFGGGDNAGHSIVVGDRELALRIVPSGALHPNVELFVGGGTVVNLTTLLEEFEKLAGIGVDISRVKVSDRAHIVLPYHHARERATERARGAQAIGTTGRGIGPAYVDRVARCGIRFADLANEAQLAEKIRDNVHREPAIDGEPLNEAEILAETLAAAKRIAPHVVDGVRYIHERLASGKRVLVEGAQGSLLDVGYGTYPFVTSSHTIAGGACIGLGIGPTAVGRVIGVAKAYCTRVGGGPFPSELDDAKGERLRMQGAEYGTVTGRPRRCGWFDAVAARYAVAVNGLTSAAITKLDVLTGFDRIGVVTGYRVRGKPVDFGAATDPGLEVEVEELQGWSEPIDGCRSVEDLPAAAREYVARVRGVLGVPIELVSVGRERTQLAQ